MGWRAGLRDFFTKGEWDWEGVVQLVICFYKESKSKKKSFLKGGGGWGRGLEVIFLTKNPDLKQRK